MSHYTYILECADDTLYVGSTNDLEKRLHQHNNLKQGAHYTKIRRPVALVYSEACESFSVARKREAELKRLSRAEKLDLIKSGTVRAAKAPKKSRVKNISAKVHTAKIPAKKIPSKYTINAKVWKWEEDMAWYFINLDTALSEKIRESRGKGMVKIQAQIGKSSWNTSLLYHTEARTYLIAIKKLIRRKEQLIEGSEVKVNFALI
ncbi:MAG: putative endonuclease [Patescibacteria group bacterium]|nr:putative endonuclease [Patescibacteria group bacterium]